tara:strand:- start:557 stop:1357 length:801 start_codon:yes stop_codon:yes gene_type:complete
MIEKLNNIFPGHVEEVSSIRLDLRSWPEVENYQKKCKAIILPIGSTEQHGPTGAIGTDAFTAEAIALELGRITGVFVTPVQSFGMAEHHLGFPGTMSLRPETLLKVMHDLVLSLAKNGFERIYIVNGHGGNIATIKSSFHQIYSTAINRQFSNSSKLRCKLANWFMSPEVFRKTQELYGDREGQHATPSEIALTLYLHPNLSEKQRPLPEASPSGPINNFQDFRERYPDGRMGSDPYLAKPSHGKSLLEIAVTSLRKDLFSFLNQS